MVRIPATCRRLFFASDNFMKTSRRNFFGKIGMAIAALATGCLAAKAVSGEVKINTEIESAWSRFQARFRARDLAKGNPIMRQTAANYAQLNGDYKNLGFEAQKMIAMQDEKLRMLNAQFLLADGRTLVLNLQNRIAPYWIEENL